MPVYFYVADVRSSHAAMRSETVPVARGRLRGRQLVTPTTSWVEVTFPGVSFKDSDILVFSNVGTENVLVFVGETAPGAGTTDGWHLPAAADRDVGIFPGDRIWVRSVTSWS